MAAGEMIANGFFDENPNMKFGSIYEFGAPGYTDPLYKRKLESNVDRLGGKAWRIRLHGDKHSAMMTKESSVFGTEGNFEHAGTHVYIVPGLKPEIMVNPSKTEINALPSVTVNPHSSDYYLDTLSAARQAASHEASISKGRDHFFKENMAVNMPDTPSDFAP